MKRKHISLIAVLLAMALMLSACGSGTSGTQSSPDPVTPAQPQGTGTGNGTDNYDGKWYLADAIEWSPEVFSSFEIRDGVLLPGEGGNYPLEESAEYAFALNGGAYCVTYDVFEDCKVLNIDYSGKHIPCMYLREPDMQRYLTDAMGVFAGQQLVPAEQEKECPFSELDIKGAEVFADHERYDLLASTLFYGSETGKRCVCFVADGHYYQIRAMGITADGNADYYIEDTATHTSYSLMRAADAQGTESAAKTETVELTLDNWSDYLEPKVVFGVGMDDWKEVVRINTYILLTPKEGIREAKIEDGRAAMTVKAPAAYSLITCDTEDGTTDLRPLTEEEIEAHKYLWEGLAFPFEKEDNFQKGVSIVAENLDILVQYLPYARATGFSESEIIKEGTKVSCYGISDFEFEVTRIIGTLTYTVQE